MLFESTARRRFMAATALAGLALMAPLSGAQAQEDTLKIVFPALWNEALDPIVASGNSSSGLTAIYDDLVGAKSDGSGLSKETGIAEDWEMSPDGREWTLHIRKGVQFHRGFGELTAEDVKFSLERLTSERAVTQYKVFFTNSIESIEVLDPYTVKVVGSEPIPNFPAMVSALQASPERFVVSKKAVEELGEDGFMRNPVGSGPYEFVEIMGGQSLQMKAVKDHWRIGDPAFENLWFLVVPEEETSIAMLLRGDADLIPVSRQNMVRLQDEGLPVVVQEGAGAINFFLEDQYADGVAVGNPLVREALNLAVDRQALVDGLFEGLGKPIGTYYTHTAVLEQLGYDWEADLYPHDPERARELLAEAGYGDGLDLDVYMYAWTGLPESADTTQAIAGMWNEIGVRTNLIPTEYAVVRAAMLRGDIPGSTGLFPAPVRPWQGTVGSYVTFMHSDGAFSHVAIPELDKLLETASSAIDPAEAQAALKDSMHFIRANHLAIPVLEYDITYGVTEKIAGWDPGFLPYNLNFNSLFQQR